MANYALGISSTMDISTAAGAKHAQSVLTAAVFTIKQIYSNMTTPPSTSTSTSTGQAPAYITAEIASYQDALARLQGS
jgi:hypothetical protein